MSDNLQKAVAGAFANFDKAMGNPADPDVKLYETLGENDFAFIAKEYGADAVADYIQTMETKRMKEGR